MYSFHSKILITAILKATVVFLLILIFASAAFSQEEELLESEVESNDASALIETLEEFQENPLNLNEASVSDLQKLPWISPVLAAKIVALRRQLHTFSSLQQLISIEEIDETLLHKIREYVTINKIHRDKTWRISLRARGYQRFPNAEDQEEMYGSPLKSYFRLRAKHRSGFQIGGIIEKDAGESALDDYRSYFCSFINSQENIQVVLGDFLIEHGQGLVMSSPYVFPKTSNPIRSATPRGRSLRPYTSVNENAGLYGIAAETTMGSISVIGYFSEKPLDATFDYSGSVSSIYTAGLHRTENEMKKKDAVKENIIGGAVRFQPTEKIEFSAIAFSSKFNRTIFSSDSVRKRFDFRGKNNVIGSVTGSVSYEPFLCFSEFARCKSGGYALATGLLIDAHQIQFMLHLRDYSPDYYNWHAKAFSHSSNNSAQNERGLYIGCAAKCTKSIRLSCYYDQFKLPWRSYTLPAPNRGTDLMLRLDYKINKSINLTGRIRYTNDYHTFHLLDEYDREVLLIGSRNKLGLRAQLHYKPTKKLSLKGRIEQVQVVLSPFGLPEAKHTSTGFLFYNDFRYSIRKNIYFSARLVFFDTDDYDARVYMFEPDVPGVLTNRCFNGRGTHWFFICRYQWRSKHNFTFKAAHTYYDHDNNLSHADESNDFTYITIQYDFTFK